VRLGNVVADAVGAIAEADAASVTANSDFFMTSPLRPELDETGDYARLARESPKKKAPPRLATGLRLVSYSTVPGCGFTRTRCSGLMKAGEITYEGGSSSRAVRLRAPVD